jgi:catechol-2,3-dioxygenase
MSIAGICELTLETTDPETLAAFYVEVIGLEILQHQEDRIWLAAGPTARLGLWRPGEKEFGDEGGAHVHFAFHADAQEIERMRRRLIARGVALQGPVEHDGGDRSIYVEDPEGNTVEVWDFFARGRTVDDGLNDGDDGLHDGDDGLHDVDDGLNYPDAGVEPGS